MRKRTIVLLLFGALSSLLIPLSVNACGPGLAVDDVRVPYHFLPHQLLGSQYAGVSDFAPRYPDRVSFKRVNLSEWSKTLGVPMEVAEEQIYHLKGTDGLPNDVKNYLLMVHQQEGLVVGEHYWADYQRGVGNAKPSITPYVKAIDSAEVMIKTVKSPKLKLRSLFIAMRLAHYSMQYDVEARLYHTHAPSLRRNLNIAASEVWHWIDSLRAGRLWRVATTPKTKAQSAFMFAGVFQKSESKRAEAFQNFSIQTDQEWAELMSLCTDSDQKAFMHVIRAAKSGGSVADELLYVAQRYPNSPWAYELLTWVMVDIQNAVLLKPDERSKPNKSQLAKVRAALRLMSKPASSKDQFLLDLGRLVVRFSSVDRLSLQEIDLFQQKYAVDERSRFLDGFRFVAFLYNIRSIDDEKETTLAALLDAFATYGDETPLASLAFARLAALYAQKGQHAQYLFARHGGRLPLEGLTVSELETTRTFEEKPGKNAWEKRLVGAGRSEHDYRSAMALRQLKEGQPATSVRMLQAGVNPGVRQEVGLRLMRQMNYPLAVEALRAHPTGYTIIEEWASFEHDPFVVSLMGNNRDVEARVPPGTWTRLRYARRMKGLQLKTLKDDADAFVHFDLATGLYNTTWFGNSPILAADFRSAVQWPSAESTNITSILGRATHHYREAYRLAADRELKAKALYGLAKIELAELRIGRNQFYMNAEDLRRGGFGAHFKKLNAYRDTQYFKEVIKQCGNYRKRWRW